MENIKRIRHRMFSSGWFANEGCYTLFDGQYGSTGKGLLASVIAEAMGDFIDTVTTNAGPNSGHTAYFGGEKIMTQQIPVASVVMDRMGRGHLCYLNAGAVVHPEQFFKELGYLNNNGVVLHPHAAVIKPEHAGDAHSDIASTGKGVGPAMAAKLGRKRGLVVEGSPDFECEGDGASRNCEVRSIPVEELGRCFVETAQGWSLGINSGFYPYTTSRECSVSQALADLGVSPARHRRSIVSLRTYPIRVGNTPDGFSGPVYPDQEELLFDDLGVAPELTTVTQRVRRIFTWSRQQYCEMLQANQPDAVFINFVNYLKPDKVDEFIRDKILRDYVLTLGKHPDFVLVGSGPFNADVALWEGTV